MVWKFEDNYWLSGLAGREAFTVRMIPKIYIEGTSQLQRLISLHLSSTTSFCDAKSYMGMVSLCKTLERFWDEPLNFADSLLIIRSRLACHAYAGSSEGARSIPTQATKPHGPISFFDRTNEMYPKSP